MNIMSSSECQVCLGTKKATISGAYYIPMMEFVSHYIDKENKLRDIFKNIYCLLHSWHGTIHQ